MNTKITENFYDMTNFKNKSKGFTLIELMIVVVILAVLVAIVLPSYQQQIQKARRADVMDALTDCAAAQARYYTTAPSPTYLDTAGLVRERLCNPDAADVLSSKEGFYTLTETGPGRCIDNNTKWCFTLTAVPAAGSSQLSDNQCAVWTIDHRGNKTASDTAGNDTRDFCWRS